MFLVSLVLGEESCYSTQSLCNAACSSSIYCYESYSSYNSYQYCCDSTIEDVATGVAVTIIVVSVVVPLVIIIVAVIITICCCVRSKRSHQQQ